MDVFYPVLLCVSGTNLLEFITYSSTSSAHQLWGIISSKHPIMSLGFIWPPPFPMEVLDNCTTPPYISATAVVRHHSLNLNDILVLSSDGLAFQRGQQEKFDNFPLDGFKSCRFFPRVMKNVCFGEDGKGSESIRGMGWYICIGASVVSARTYKAYHIML